MKNSRLLSFPATSMNSAAPRVTSINTSSIICSVSISVGRTFFFYFFVSAFPHSSTLFLLLEYHGVENNFPLAYIADSEEDINTLADLGEEEETAFCSDVATFVQREIVKQEDGGSAAEKDMIVLDDERHPGPTNVPVRPTPAYTHEEG